MLRPVLLAAVLALAGCLQAAEVEPASAPLPEAVASGRVVSHDALGGLLPVDPAWADASVRLAPTGFDGGEPTIGVASYGAVFAAVGNGEVARSDDGGATWRLVTGRDLLRDPKASLDPWIWVDPLTDRLINAPLYVACSWMAWSDDGGGSWDFNPLAGCGLPAHDHQKLTTGPPARGVATDGYPNVVYYSYNSFREEGTWISVSLDGGRTFGVGRAVHPPSPCHSGVAGPVAVAPDGTAYSPKPTCDGVAVAVSTDSGRSWSRPALISGVGAAQALAHMTDAAVDAAGNAYVTWTGKDGLAYLAASSDRGATWSEPRLVSPPGVDATVFNAMAAGAEGRVVVAYLGTASGTEGWPTKDAQSADDDTVWHLHLSFVEGAAGPSPVVTTVRATPEDDPVQVGCIWQSGGVHECRNLADFIDVVQRDGRAYVVFTDGCAGCSRASESRGSAVVAAYLERGPSLLGGVLDPLPV